MTYRELSVGEELFIFNNEKADEEMYYLTMLKYNEHQEFFLK